MIHLCVYIVLFCLWYGLVVSELSLFNYFFNNHIIPFFNKKKHLLTIHKLILSHFITKQKINNKQIKQ